MFEFTQYKLQSTPHQQNELLKCTAVRRLLYNSVVCSCVSEKVGGLLGLRDYINESTLSSGCGAVDLFNGLYNFTFGQ